MQQLKKQQWKNTGQHRYTALIRDYKVCEHFILLVYNRLKYFKNNYDYK